MSVKFNFGALETGFEADWPVTVNVPIDGGKVEAQTFMARFRTPTEDEVEAAEAITDRGARLRHVIRTGFVGFGAGETETLTDELFGRLWANDAVQLGLLTAFGSFRTGSPAKN